MLPYFPTYRIGSVLELTADRLARINISSLLLDVDSTLKDYTQPRPTPLISGWLDALTSGGIRICLVSNGRRRRLAPFANALDLPLEAMALKPLPFALKRAMRRLQFERKRTAMVGDQVFTDVLAGRFAGVRTVLVEPILPEREPFYTRVKRLPEAVLVRWTIPKIDWDDIERRDAPVPTTDSPHAAPPRSEPGR